MMVKVTMLRSINATTILIVAIILGLFLFEVCNAFVFIPSRQSTTTTTSRLYVLEATAATSLAPSLLATWQPWVSIALRAPSGMGIGVKTAQFLMDEKRQKELKKEMQQKFPQIPKEIIDACIDSTAKGFTSVAPQKLKEALLPGGMKKVQPELQKAIVDSVLEQSVLSNFFIKPDDKAIMKSQLEGVVGNAIGYVFKDAQEELAAPEARLEMLKKKKKKIYKEIGMKRRLSYWVQYYPKKTGFVALSSALLIHQLQYAPLMKSLKSFGIFLFSRLWEFRKNLLLTIFAAVIVHQLQYAPLVIGTRTFLCSKIQNFKQAMTSSKIENE